MGSEQGHLEERRNSMWCLHTCEDWDSQLHASLAFTCLNYKTGVRKRLPSSHNRSTGDLEKIQQESRRGKNAHKEQGDQTLALILNFCGLGQVAAPPGAWFMCLVKL